MASSACSRARIAWTRTAREAWVLRDDREELEVPAADQAGSVPGRSAGAGERPLLERDELVGAWAPGQAVAMHSSTAKKALGRSVRPQLERQSLTPGIPSRATQFAMHAQSASGVQVATRSAHFSSWQVAHWFSSSPQPADSRSARQASGTGLIVPVSPPRRLRPVPRRRPRRLANEPRPATGHRRTLAATGPRRPGSRSCRLPPRPPRRAGRCT
jgi:hypothetical protein